MINYGPHKMMAAGFNLYYGCEYKTTGQILKHDGIKRAQLTKLELRELELAIEIMREHSRVFDALQVLFDGLRKSYMRPIEQGITVSAHICGFLLAVWFRQSLTVESHDVIIEGSGIEGIGYHFNPVTYNNPVDAWDALNNGRTLTKATVHKFTIAGHSWYQRDKYAYKPSSDQIGLRYAWGSESLQECIEYFVKGDK